MAMPYQSGKKMLLIGQLSIIIFALVAGFLGRSGWGYWLFVIIYFIVFSVIMQKLNPTAKASKASLPEVEAGKILYEEKQSFQILTEDTEYQKEMAEQMKVMQVNMLMFFPIMLYFLLAFKPITSVIPPKFENPHIGYAVAYLILFEGSFILNRLGLYFNERRMRKQQKKMIMINAPRAFTVTSEGIIYSGLASKTAIKFPLKDYEIKYDVSRKFVELIHETDKVITKIRFYTRHPEKVYDIIKRRNEKALKEYNEKKEK